MTVTVYVEGGGDRKKSRAECRKGFSKFFSRAGLRGRMPRIVASGSRQQAYRDYVAEFRRQQADLLILLVDSKYPITDHQKAWSFLREKDSWRALGTRLANAHSKVHTPKELTPLTYWLG